LLVDGNPVENISLIADPARNFVVIEGREDLQNTLARSAAAVSSTFPGVPRSGCGGPCAGSRPRWAPGPDRARRLGDTCDLLLESAVCVGRIALAVAFCIRGLVCVIARTRKTLLVLAAFTFSSSCGGC
jgi:hypothetical protein